MSLVYGTNPMGSEKDFPKAMANSRTFPNFASESTGSNSLNRASPAQKPNWITVMSYGVGHFLNDMTAACWFNYLLVFMIEVAEVGTTQAGLIMLSGQITDALWTPVVGLVSDMIPAPSFGRRKSWLLAGAILVNFSFFFVFSPCYFCDFLPVDNTTKTIMYCIFASIFNVGWATLQVSHMSLAPELTEDESERVKLYSARNAGAIIATLLVLGIATAAFAFCGITHRSFLILAICAIGFGDFFTLVFLIGVKELPPEEVPPHDEFSSTPDLNIQTTTNFQRRTFKWYHWFKMAMFWQVGIIYMLSRVTVNIFQVFTPFYLNYSLDLLKTNRASIAEVPVTVMIVSFIWTMLLKQLNKRLGRRSAYTFGAVVTIVSLLGVYYLPRELWYLIFVLAVPLGVGTTTVLVTGISMEADTVGNRTHVGAFVYGFMSFLDKAANGLLIVFLTKYSKDPDAIRDIIFFTPAGSAFIAMVLAYTIVYYWKKPQGASGDSDSSSLTEYSAPLLQEPVDYDE